MSKTTSQTQTVEEAKKTVAPKGTKTSEVILGTAVGKLNAGMKALSDMMGGIDKLEERVNENILIISDQEDKIAAKALELKNAVAQNKIELQQAYETNKAEFAMQWMKDNGYALISVEELNGLKADLASATSDTEATIKKEVSAAAGAITAKYNSEKREQELQFLAKEAQNVAALSQKDEKIKFLEEQVVSWRNALDKERDASVQRAQAGAINQTITSGK